MSGPAVIANPAYVPSHGAGGGGADSPPGEREGGKVKSGLVLSAEKIDRRTALLTGYLRKKNSQNRWQKRYFEIVGQYWVYYKTHTSGEMLCAMDLWKASPPVLVAPGGPLDGDEGTQSEFSITWDRYRVFRASSPAEAVRWVNAIQQVQALRPADVADRSLAGPPTPSLAGLSKSGGDSTRLNPTEAREWVDKERKARKSGPTPTRTDDDTEGGVCGSCVLQ